MSKEYKTIKNLEAAFAGESMAHIKYLYFARICRAYGDEKTAKVFEDTAAQELLHAIGHAELLFPRQNLNVEKCLKLAIEGETHEYSEMYPQFRNVAVEEGNSAAAGEFGKQIEESVEHANNFQTVLRIASKRFSALTKVEERHAKRYQNVLEDKK